MQAQAVRWSKLFVVTYGGKSSQAQEAMPLILLAKDTGTWDWYQRQDFRFAPAFSPLSA